MVFTSDKQIDIWLLEEKNYLWKLRLHLDYVQFVLDSPLILALTIA